VSLVTTLTSFPASRAHILGLVWTLIRTDFKVRYHGTFAGFLWALLKPLAMVLVLLGVFSFILGGTRNYAVNLVIGLLLYDFFGEATKAGLVSLRSKAFLLTKARAPSWVIVVTSTSNAAITLGVVSALFVLVLAVVGKFPSMVGVALFVVYVCHYLVMVMGISLFTSVLFLRYRDLHEVWDVVTQAGFFVAPVVYPLDILPERLHLYLYVWPPTPIIQFSRAVLIEGQVPSLRAHILLSVETAVILLLGALVFRRYSPRAAEFL
jgi:ABC-type polysaccharide/polyol phosphate export permease